MKVFLILCEQTPFEIHLQGHNFTGLGTKLDKKLNSHGTANERSISINKIDNAAYHRDYAIPNMIILKRGIMFVIRQCLMS